MIARLKGSKPEIRVELIPIVAEIAGKKSLATLLGCLDDETPQVRIAAIQSLGQLRDRRAFTAVQAHLKDDPSPQVRFAPIRALGSLKDTRGVKALVAYLDDADPEVRQAVSDALGQIGDRSAVEPLLQHLDDPDTNVRVTALRSAAKLAGSSSALQLVSKDADGIGPWLDPRVPIDEARVTFAAKRLGAKPEEIKRLYEVLSKDLQFKLNLSWASADTRD